jgi:phosphoribosylformylglycinamidine (FGAM) synthase PurS component
VSERVVAIGLKIPDNEAYTALVTLQRLGVPVERVERNDVWYLHDDGSEESLPQRIERNETMFNPNKHRLSVLDRALPRGGEAWIDELDAHDEVREHLGGKPIDGVRAARRYVGWRLFDAAGAPVPRDVVAAAVERLLCNPAIEKAIY